MMTSITMIEEVTMTTEEIITMITEEKIEVEVATKSVNISMA